jgi:hypothetical protein
MFDKSTRERLVYILEQIGCCEEALVKLNDIDSTASVFIQTSENDDNPVSFDISWDEAERLTKERLSDLENEYRGINTEDKRV